MDDRFSRFDTNQTTNSKTSASKSSIATNLTGEFKTSATFTKEPNFGIGSVFKSQTDLHRLSSNARFNDSTKRSFEVKIDAQADPFLLDYDIEKQHKQTLKKVVNKQNQNTYIRRLKNTTIKSRYEDQF